MAQAKCFTDGVAAGAALCGRLYLGLAYLKAADVKSSLGEHEIFAGLNQRLAGELELAIESSGLP